ncbi:MAG: hypothetical protein KDB02_07880 [Acidimicrobiales bacterium]|nr:hypothetical protein [Acidimicrobiales bacterium]
MPDTLSPEVDEPLAMRWSIGRILAVLAFLAMVAFWAWIFTGGPKKANPDRLADRAWVSTAVDRCQRMLDDLDEIPSAAETPTPAERAKNVRAADAVLSKMVDDLEASAPTDPKDREVLDHWFNDWRVYLKDRARYADAVATDPGAVFEITENERLHRGVDDTLKTFADVNDMPDCAPPGDVG